MQGPRHAWGRIVALVALAIGAVAVALVVGAIPSRRAPSRKAPPPTRAPVARRPQRHHRAVRLLKRHGQPVPILEYHVIAAAPRGAPYPRLFVSPAIFAKQMIGLARAGYHAVTLPQLFAYWRRGVPLPRRPVVVSFDDGYLSDYTRARPVLERLHWPGELNLELANVRRRGGLTARMVQRLIHDGWDVESHTLTHPDLTTVAAGRLRQELVGSRAAIRRRFGVPADYFCYPAGQYDARVVRAVRAAGYRGALTEHPVLASRTDPYELGRLEVQQPTSAAMLVRALASR